MEKHTEHCLKRQIYGDGRCECNTTRSEQENSESLPCPHCNPTGVFRYGDERCELCHGKAFLTPNA
jgi:DnaJ-class molecular chaperone